MEFQRFFQNVLGLAGNANSIRPNSELPAVIAELYQWNARLPESLLKTDVRILQQEEIYEVGKLTVFAEEAQCVVRWAFADNRNDAECVALNHEDPVDAWPEDFPLDELLLGMVVNNALSSTLLEYYQYVTLPAECAAQILRRIPPAGGFSDVKAIVHGDVACMLEVGDELFVSAASRSEENLNAFVRLIQGMGNQS